MRPFRKSFLILFALMGLSSCKFFGTKTGNPTDPGKLQTDFIVSSDLGTSTHSILWRHLDSIGSTLIPPSYAFSTFNTFEFLEAWITVREIGLQFDSVDSDELVQETGPHYINLLEDTSYLADRLELNRGSKILKTNILLQGLNNPPNEAPALLSGNSFVVRYKAGSKTISFAAENSFILSKEGIQTLELLDTRPLVLQINLESIVSKIDSSSLPDGAIISESNRVPTHSENPCPLLIEDSENFYSCFMEALEMGFDLGRDDDRDGQLDDTEDRLE